VITPLFIFSNITVVIFIGEGHENQEGLFKVKIMVELWLSKSGFQLNYEF